MTTHTHVEYIREAMPATTSRIYLNTGTFGPLPKTVLDVMQTRMQHEWLNGRLGHEAFASISTTYSGARKAVATLLHAQETEIALTDNTGEGLNIVSYGFDWHADDEVITTNHEHISALAPLYQIRDRYGIKIRFADLGGKADKPIHTAIEPLITPRTRLIVASHVTWSTGTILDIQSLNTLARTHNIPVLIDGAQSAGNIAINVKALDADFYAIPMQKWLCGPDGTGALYVRSESRHYLKPTYVGYYSTTHEENIDWALQETAQCFELGGRQTAAIAGQHAILIWLEQEVGYDWLFKRITELNYYAYNALKELPGITILTPQPGSNGLLSFKLEGRNDGDVVQYLQDQHNISIRNIPTINALRISTGFYNTEEEIDVLVNALKAM